MPEKLHFHVEPEFITNTARNLFHFEQDRERAMDLLSCVCGLNEEQKVKILSGDAELVTVPNESGMSHYREKEDIEFKVMLRKFQIVPVPIRTIRAEKHLDPCNDIECEFSKHNQCCFGLRNNYGCPQEDPIVMDRMKEILDIRIILEVQDFFIKCKRKEHRN